MISKLRFSLIAVIMLVLLGFGFQNQAKGQIGLDGLFCPAVPNTTGWLETEIVGFGITGEPDFTGALIGTVESLGADNVGGLDWHHVDFTSYYTPTPTNEAGSQLVSWWTQKNGRNTYLQVTNSDGGPITVHVRIHNEDCLEIRDFCDTYTGYDTHEYNFGDLFSNGGADIADANLQNVEGWVVVTAVDDCGQDDEHAYDHNALAGQLIVHDDNDYLYGVNTYARQAVCFNETFDEDVELIVNGSFESGSFNPGWNSEFGANSQGNSGVINANGISPAVQPPDGDFMAFLSSSARIGFTSPDYQGIFGSELATAMLIETGSAETNVSVIQSNSFSLSDPFDGANVATYDLAFLAPNDLLGFGTCYNYAAALLINISNIPATIADAKCYNEPGFGSITTTNNGVVNCVSAQDDNVSYALGPFNFEGGRSSFFSDSLSIPSGGDAYVVQFVTGQEIFDGCWTDNIIFSSDTGALVDNLSVIETIEITEFCDGELTGAFNAYLDVVRPDTLSAQFNLLPGSPGAGADVVHINFADSYGPPYRPVPAFSLVSVSIFDDVEVDQSCGDALVCFVRLGIDDALVQSENFNPATPTPTPTITPSITPTPTPVTPTPTPTNNGGSSSCSIAASPVQLGTALANVLIPLVPVAFAFGVRAVRRRKK